MSTAPKKLVIIGAAPTGLGFAYRLNELINEGNEAAKQVDVTILEQESFAGGLSHSEKDEKGFLWDMGGHVTFSENCPYYEKATHWALEEWNSLQRNCLVDMNYLFDKKGIHLVPYPAQFAVPLFPEKVKQACLADLKERYAQTEEAKSPTTFQEWILNNFGPTILDVFFTPYTKKVWTVDTSKMNPNWVGTRVAKLPQEKLESLCAMNPDELANADFGWGPNATFIFPKYGGTGAVWQKMADKLPQAWIKYNHKAVDVDYKNKKVVVEKKDGSKEEFAYDALVSTTPVDLLVKHTGICPEINVEHSKVFIVGVGLELPMPESMKNYTWLYFPDPAVPFYRITFLSRYGDDVTPDNSKYWSVMVECARQPDEPDTEEQIRDQSVEGLITKGIIKREQIVSVWSTTLPYGYPIPTVARDSEMARAHRVLESHQIYSRGRFGGWKYEVSNQDHCFIQGKEICDRLVLGEDEKLYRTGLSEKRG